LPRNLVPKIKPLADSRQGSDREKENSFANCAQFHRLIAEGRPRATFAESPEVLAPWPRAQLAQPLGA
jgi:hypothetical protein